MSSRVSRLRYRIKTADMVSPNLTRSLADLNDIASHPPARIQRLPHEGHRTPLVLYIFRVPGRLDLCLSTVRPGADVVTDIDIAASLYYVRIMNQGERISMVVVRRNPATDSNNEVAEIHDPPGHIDVFEPEYANIESRYWEMNGQDHYSLGSNFGCYVRIQDEKTSMSTPWVGICHFSSIKFGNAIKGVHALRHFEGGPSPDDVPVSELRFNFLASSNSSKARKLAKRASVPLPLVLPPQEAGTVGRRPRLKSMFSNSKSADTTPAMATTNRFDDAEECSPVSPLSFQEYPAPRIPRKLVSSSSFTSDANLDLSLGQEKLGGGFDGEQAKLAKLIVEAEGEKMLDLLVAVNVLLFRRAFAAVNL